MARTARAGDLETRTPRLKLKVQKKPYWSRTGKGGVHIGYRRRKPYGKDANGSWLVRRYTGTTYETEVFAEADDFSEADGLSILSYAQAMERLGTELSELQRRTRYTVQDAVDDYLTYLKLNGKSASETEGALKHYAVRYFGPDRALSDLTRDDFAKWPAWALENPPPGRRKKPSPPKKLTPEESADALRRRKERINRVLNSVLACFNRAYENEHVPSREAWNRLRRFRGTEQPRKRWLDLKECTQLMAECRPDFRKILQAGLLTGARWSELRRLRVGDYSDGTVLVAQSKAGKPRHVFLTEEGQVAFDDWTAGRDWAALIFERDGGDEWGSHDQHRPMRAACDAARIKPAIGFHILRHTYASLLVQNGTPLPFVASQLGHSDTRMVSKHYGHLAPSPIKEAVRNNLPSFGMEIATKTAGSST